MDNVLGKIFLAGVGALSMTYDKSKEILDELIDQGKVTVEQGRQLNEELIQVIKNEKEEDKEVVLDKLNIATKDDIKDIISRLENLEQKDKND